MGSGLLKPVMKQTTLPTIPITRQIFQTLALTIAGVVFLTGVGMLIDPGKAIAFGVGGAISLLPNAYFAMRVLLVPAPLDAQTRLRQLYAAEATKLLLCTLLFALTFSLWKALSPAWVLTGFAITHIGYLILSMRLIARTNRKQAAQPTKQSGN